MSWHKEWNAIEECISEFTDVCSEFVAALTANKSDSMATIKNVILPMAVDTANKIHLLSERYQSQLPEEALQIIRSLDVAFESGFISAIQKTPAALSHLSAKFRRFRAEFNYLTSDLEGVVLRLTARGLIHLQRSIVADNDIRNKWMTAYQRGETACERLGATHLLLHGIWSFKANSAGERTDLILGEPLRDENLAEVYLAAEGLVLTEWKLANSSNSRQKYEEALEQAALYAAGSLAPIELKGYRYLVIVSENTLNDLPGDIEDEGIIYKYINIAVNPESPSRQVRT